MVSIAGAQLASQPDAKAPKPPTSKITVSHKSLNFKTVTAITRLSFSITDSGAAATGSVGGVGSPFSITAGGRQLRA